MRIRRLAVASLAVAVSIAVYAGMSGAGRAEVVALLGEVRLVDRATEIAANGRPHDVSDIQVRATEPRVELTGIEVTNQGFAADCGVPVSEMPYSVGGSPRTGELPPDFVDAGAWLRLQMPVTVDDGCTRSGAVVTASFMQAEDPTPTPTAPATPTSTPTRTPSPTPTRTPSPTPTSTPTPTPTPAPEPPPPPPPPPAPPAAAEPAPVVVTTAKIVLEYSIPLETSPSLFTLTIGGEGGVSGPGPRQATGPVGIASGRIITYVAPDSLTTSTGKLMLTLDEVICVSDLRATVAVSSVASFQLSFLTGGEVVTCTAYYSAVAGAVTSGAAAATPTPEPPAAAEPKVEPPPQSEAARPKILRTVPTFGDVISGSPKAAGANFLLTLVVVLLLLISSGLFNQTVEENRDDIEGFFERFASPVVALVAIFGRVWSRAAGGSSGVSRVAAPIGVLMLTGLIYGFLEPGFGFNSKSVVVFASLVVGGGVVTYLYEGGEAWITRRRLGLDAGVRLYPASIVIAVVSVALCRAVGFQPGIVFGFIASSVLLVPATVSRRDSGGVLIWPALALLAVSLGAWLLVAPLREISEGQSGILAALPESIAVAVFIVGMEGLFCTMIPLRFMDGKRLWDWNKWVWLAVFVSVSFLFFHILFYREEAYFDALRNTKVVGAGAVFTAYLAVTFGTWGFFNIRNRGEGGRPA